MTPIQHLFDGLNHLYIKREDLLPFSFGGNKARKAKLFFEEIDRGDYDCVVTYGSSSSNHCRAVANMACARKMKCILIQPMEQSSPTFNSMMSEKLFQAESVIVPVNEVHDTIERRLSELKADGYRPYCIPGGGHGNIGTQAYVDCYEEILAYEAENKIYFDDIFFASGTGTTQAGLVCGSLIHGDHRNIVGISIARKNPYGRNVVIDSVCEYLKEHQISVGDDAVERAVCFDDAYTSDGYGSHSKEIENTLISVIRDHGISMDMTYTAKAYYGMTEYLKREGVSGHRVLFIHTGGTPLYFDYLRGLDT